VAYASRSGRARTSAKSPRAFAVCFRCGMWYNRDQLKFQVEWRGASLKNIYVLVCDRCYDVPNEQLRAIVLPADPTPIYFPSVEAFDQIEANYRTTLPVQFDPVTGLQLPVETQRVTQNGQNRETQPTGRPDGLDPDATMPWVNGTQPEGIVLPVVGVYSFGMELVYVTTSSPHGLVTNNQVSVRGLSLNAACGVFSVTVQTATAFNYQCAANTGVNGSLLTSGTLIATIKVGLPRNFDYIPQVG
jgi:hypothetical protein